MLLTSRYLPLSELVFMQPRAARKSTSKDCRTRVLQANKKNIEMKDLDKNETEEEMMDRIIENEGGDNKGPRGRYSFVLSYQHDDLWLQYRLGNRCYRAHWV